MLCRHWKTFPVFHLIVFVEVWSCSITTIFLLTQSPTIIAWKLPVFSSFLYFPGELQLPFYDHWDFCTSPFPGSLQFLNLNNLVVMKVIRTISFSNHFRSLKLWHTIKGFKFRDWQDLPALRSYIDHTASRYLQSPICVLEMFWVLGLLEMHSSWGDRQYTNPYVLMSLW